MTAKIYTFPVNTPYTIDGLNEFISRAFENIDLGFTLKTKAVLTTLNGTDKQQRVLLLKFFISALKASKFNDESIQQQCIIVLQDYLILMLEGSI